MKWLTIISVLLSLAPGCASFSALSATKMDSTSIPTDQPSEVVLEIRKFYRWLLDSEQLVRPTLPNPMTRFQGRPLDPETLEPLTIEKPPIPTNEELIHQIGDSLNGCKGDPC